MMANDGVKQFERCVAEEHHTQFMTFMQFTQFCCCSLAVVTAQFM
jgi:hypothetical protein